MADLSKQSKNQRAAAARERAEQMRLQAEARSRRTRTTIVAVTTVVVAALVVGVFFVVQNARQQQAARSVGPAGLSQNGGLLVGQEGATATVTEYFDYMCPACNQFESTYSSRLEALEGEGKIKIEYVPVSILDGASNGTKYSTRAASAGYCVIGSDKDKFAAFTKAMYADQPAENTAGLTTEQVADIAGSVGVSQAGQTCITDEKYTGYATKVTDQASKDGLTGTPFIRVNGEAVDRQSGGTLEKALADAGVSIPAA